MVGGVCEERGEKLETHRGRNVSMKVTHAIAALALALTAACSRLRPIDRAAWTADLDTLLVHIPTAYANFEYSVRTRGLNPESLQAAARQHIAGARTEAGGRAAITGLLDAFGDAHISVRLSAPAARESNAAERYTSCSQLGFRGRDRSFHDAIRRQPGFREDAGGIFPTARIDRPSGVTRVFRIPLFSQTQFPELCKNEWPRLAAADGSCDDVCAAALFRAIGDSALADLARQLGADASSPSALLIIDITGNGGGSEWVVDVARRVSPRPLVSPAVGFVRAPCDWSGVWRGAPVPACSPLVIDSARPLPTLTPSLWQGRILILTDRATASASEEFAAMLVDAGVAHVAGERTMGIGCGFVNGGGDFRLPRSGLAIRMPNCARFRRDQTNERDGITPDAAVWTDRDDGAERARKLGSAIDRILASAR